MTDHRIIDLSEHPARLTVAYDQLVIRHEEAETSVPLAELACLVVSNPQVSYSHAVLEGLARHGASLVVCDQKHMPAGLMLPLAGHFSQSERFVAQAQASAPLMKNLWKQIVVAKIKAQGQTLEALRGQDFGLGAMARSVRSGDPENLEAQAARKYWTRLFDDPNFKRDREKPDQNRNLNYGYAVLRAIVARAACARGLHPGLGLHHHNRYDPFPLADDLMEPFRPIVDRAVAAWVAERGPTADFDREAKRALIEPLTGRFLIEGEERTLFDIVARAAKSLARAFAGSGRELDLPEPIPVPTDKTDSHGDTENTEKKF